MVQQNYFFRSVSVKFLDSSAKIDLLLYIMIYLALSMHQSITLPYISAFRNMRKVFVSVHSLHTTQCRGREYVDYNAHNKIVWKKLWLRDESTAHCTRSVTRNRSDMTEQPIDWSDSLMNGGEKCNCTSSFIPYHDALILRWDLIILYFWGARNLYKSKEI